MEIPEEDAILWEDIAPTPALENGQPKPRSRTLKIPELAEHLIEVKYYRRVGQT